MDKRTREYPLLDIPLHPFLVLVLYLTTTVCHLLRVGYDLPNYQIFFTVLGSATATFVLLVQYTYIYLGSNPWYL